MNRCSTLACLPSPADDPPNPGHFASPSTLPFGPTSDGNPRRHQPCQTRERDHQRRGPSQPVGADSPDPQDGTGVALRRFGRQMTPRRVWAPTRRRARGAFSGQAGLNGQYHQIDLDIRWSLRSGPKERPASSWNGSLAPGSHNGERPGPSGRRQPLPAGARVMVNERRFSVLGISHRCHRSRE